MPTTYPNGQIPSTALASVGGGQMLRADAAVTWLALMALAARSGRSYTLTDSYRPKSVQLSIFLDRYKVGIVSPYGDYRIYNGRRYGRRAGTASAATPGTSNHGTGTAVDVSGIFNAFGTPRTAAYQWLAANAPAYGWVNPAWAWNRSYWEPWHWEFDPARVTVPISNPTPIPTVPDITVPDDPIIEEIIMAGTPTLVYAPKVGDSPATALYFFDPADGTFVGITTPEERDIVQHVYEVAGVKVPVKSVGLKRRVDVIAAFAKRVRAQHGGK